MDNTFKDHLSRSMKEMQQRIDVLLEDVPNMLNDTELFFEDSAATAVSNINAIEEEWILDPSLRMELSAVTRHYYLGNDDIIE